MEAVQEEGIDKLANLEERITRAVQVITGLRSENGQLQQRLKATEDELASTKSELEETQALSAEFQKENGELGQKVASLSQELETMRGERNQVKSRIEKLLDQLDLLSAS
ncbi:MAG: cell division protein ZapB [Acidobacteriaceae bacterium]|nr:cell division protein ZapB [Acidobacteriaceae bacterium]